MADFFYHIHTYFKSRKLFLSLILLFLSVILAFLGSRLQFEENITDLIPETEASRTLNKVIKNTNFADNIIVNISLSDRQNPDLLPRYAEAMYDSLQSCCGTFIKGVRGKVTGNDMQETIDFMTENLPFFLEPSDYDYLQKHMQPDSLKAMVANHYRTFMTPGGMVAKKMLREDPFGLRFRALKKLEKLQISDRFTIENGFLTTRDKKHILLFIKPALPVNETDKNSRFVKKLYRISEHLNKKFDGKVRSEYYGSTVIAVGNAAQIKRDIQYTVSIAMLVLLALLIFFYRRWFAPLLLFLPSVFGALIAVASLYLLRGRISAISIGIGSVLLGITIDYSLHILTHFRKNRNIRQLYRDVAKPILMSSLTTAVAFLCLIFLHSRALQDLGIFAAISVLSTSFFALVLIPLLYRPKAEHRKVSNPIEKIAAYSFDKNKFFIGFLLLAIGVGFFAYKKARFSKDLNKMNYRSEALLKAETGLDSLLDLTSKSVYVVSYGNDMDSILASNEEVNLLLEKELQNGKIQRYSSNASLFLSQERQREKITMWNRFWNDSVVENLKQNLILAGKKFGFRKQTYQPFFVRLHKKYNVKPISDFESVNAFLSDEYIRKDGSLKTVATLVKLKPGQKSELKNKLNRLQGVVLIDRQEVNETFLSGLKQHFSSLILYSFIAIVLILGLFFRSIGLTLLTITPIVVTWLITLGIMGVFGIEFTIFNVIITTFIFGLGVDYSIFTTNALVKDYTFGTRELPTYKTAILLSVITTLLGVGVLIFAKHPAMRSIAILSLVGILTTVFTVFTLQPLLFRLFITNRTKKGLMPVKFREFLLSLFLLSFYALGGMLLSLFSIVVMPLIPVSKKKKFIFLHKATARLVTAVLYSNPFVKKKVINKQHEHFNKPAIIIANHASSLDTLTIGMLTHKTIYLVNDWVYRSPVFGILARVMGFYPVSEGVEESVGHLKEKIRQGYSLMVFPESKRSFTNKIGRFHKGAFFLQERFKLDIVPVYLHGNAEVMPKGDLLIHDGSLTLIVGERIPYDDLRFGKTVRERTKSISKYFKDTFYTHRIKLEHPDYFKGILYANYMYKERWLFRAVQSDFEKCKSIYHEINLKLPLKAKILHLTNDYGQLDVLMISHSPERKITSVYLNEIEEQIATSCYTLIHRKVKVLKQVQDALPGNFDVLLLSYKMLSNITIPNPKHFKWLALYDRKKCQFTMTDISNLNDEDIRRLMDKR